MFAEPPPPPLRDCGVLLDVAYRGPVLVSYDVHSQQHVIGHGAVCEPLPRSSTFDRGGSSGSDAQGTRHGETSLGRDCGGRPLPLPSAQSTAWTGSLGKSRSVVVRRRRRCRCGGCVAGLERVPLVRNS